MHMCPHAHLSIVVCIINTDRLHTNCVYMCVCIIYVYIYIYIYIYMIYAYVPTCITEHRRMYYQCG